MSIIIKTEEQIQGIRRSSQLAIDALDHIEQFIKPGVSTEDLDRAAEAYIRQFGATPAPLGYHGYPKSICTSLNEVICHGIPRSDVVLKEGDIIKVDVSTILNGYFGDTCKTYPVGEVSTEATELISVARDCLDIGICAVRPEAEFGQIGKAISKYARSRGFSVVYQFAGHGVGLRLHEKPNVSHDDRDYDATKMKPGMIFTIEPMINQGEAEGVIDEADRWTVRTRDQKLSAQFEHTILVTEDGSEVLTR